MRRFALFVPGALAACSNLSILEENICGNRVIEADRGEECDGEPGCGARETAHPCRYTCEGGAEPACPGGYGCGADGVCRRPSGHFELILAVSTETTQDLLVGDVNGDGCAETVYTTRRGSVVTAFESRSPGLCPASEQSLRTRKQEAQQALGPAPVLAGLASDEKLDLITTGSGLLGDGLLVYLASDGPFFSPALYPSVLVAEKDARSFKVQSGGTDALLLLPAEGKAGAIRLLRDPALNPRALGEMPEAVRGASVVSTGDLDGVGAAAGKACDEIVVAAKDQKALRLYGFCGASAEPSFAPLPSPTVTLDGNGTIRDRNAAIAVVDVNEDGALDLLVNATDDKIHVAYGLGDGRFHSAPPPVTPPGMPDQRTSPLALPDDTLAAQLGNPDVVFVAADFDATRPGPELVPIPCPPAMPFASPLCVGSTGGCEAAVADLDADGDLDIVSSEGEEPDLIVRRGDGAGGFHAERLETQCPPRHVGVGDVDGDGVVDVAFFDQVAPSLEAPITALTVAYGNAFAAPSAPATQGLLAEAKGLSVGSFVPGAPGKQILAARTIEDAQAGSALALVEAQEGRLLLAPAYFPSATESTTSVERMTLRALAAGRFSEADDAPRSSLAIVADAPQGVAGPQGLGLVEGDRTASTLRRPDTSMVPPLACDACLLMPLRTGTQATDDGRPALDDLLLLGDGEVHVYRPVSTSFVSQEQRATSHTFRAIDDTSNPPTYAPRPVVADLNRDGVDDLVIARSSAGVLVAYFLEENGSFAAGNFTEVPLDVGCAGDACKALAFAVLDADADAAPELAVVGPGMQAVYDIDTRERKLAPLPASFSETQKPPPGETRFTALGAGDVDGDGVDDLVVAVTSTFLTVLRGIPVVE
ncbi:FG-GAP-like repeat-containing protein [Chondromyces apiculatus]|nr:FG-GAP-like repeat-containing protein [Chondromyces apiculatus]